MLCERELLCHVHERQSPHIIAGMQRLKRNKTTPRFVPDFIAPSLEEVDFKVLRDKGVRYIAFDADATIVPYRGKALTETTKNYLQQNRKLFEGWCIASNRITRDLLPLAVSMDAELIQATLFTRKPSKRFFRRVINHFGCKPHEIAMIGDKLIADMYGGKRSGMVTVWVERMGRDSAHDTLLQVRRFEKRLMKRYMK